MNEYIAKAAIKLRSMIFNPRIANGAINAYAKVVSNRLTDRGHDVPYAIWELTQLEYREHRSGWTNLSNLIIEMRRGK